MRDQDRFATLHRPERVWAVASVHGERDRLAAVHDQLETRIRRGDRLVYLGNVLGHGGQILEAVREMLLFRRAVLARPGSEAVDVAFLRGAQEEMWQKLLQVHFAPNPPEVIQWMAQQGVDATLQAYGGSVERGLAAAREGTVALSRWTASLRDAQRDQPGHDRYMAAMRRAAVTDDHALLFVHAGVDSRRPLNAQRDSFWWGAPGFTKMTEPFAGFRRVVRGYDPRHAGLVETGFAVSMDAGCGFGGPLLAVCFSPEGKILDSVEG